MGKIGKYHIKKSDITYINMENYGVNCKTHINIFKANKKVIILAELYNKTMKNMKNVLKCIMIQVKNLKSLNKTHTKPKILNKYHAKL